MKNNIALKVKKLTAKELKNVVGGDARDVQYRIAGADGQEGMAFH
ncbi:bacteriocin [Pseudoalteromonas sp. MMG005]|nr:bacteriocin [Pseudoalteromonas sp. MMG005]MBQ4848431.1 bacteriocin [Pseudoalteromonas sp. MMG005]